ncbi:FMN-dependent NADH-azoreductase [Clostridium acetobutylicum]|uniref:FMN-dependent NADH:quinone oxidoreductase 2 n=1 Tax=Clostridium acetobutylicum (strain ATCC 824 / DSM 792 / JCM 1419 / IAM 19013 / LMG 5710 / NBRC 13948 / NRRL B-527 / VKM B-1787 / 2291 / W) TaxID=272562 RepID=AZOR2_CLOAB|nr:MULTISPECIES: FMN-dependent NADH-azoreductase [Clostridium]Q97DQ1.1 RecName: Full=FMN-dependent NADH:quinone oxidoreductase 2; AltName: Full=Azo-dye reductase 2; AltName: Full=FMN-dependent NADH-azo compound oxidoreductase 2; AltName: Full=FMN-dependent NADH-azoreductase 2 [Clostridium acetobutylicum ATCC 824]AAK81351.1 Acyl carrier protein phosphodiesterase [Clostridium acetobutylicum ATCC 824]ADZ22462.1 Acyl carrier protein phosphodiesterase [Clostridium acetobutylicum EA 2018]AEI32839.1 A
MSKVLYIKANAKPEGVSRTFKISDSFIEEYRNQKPNDEIITLDLYKEGISFLTEEAIKLHVPKQGEGKDHHVLKYAYQFAEADKYVIAAPFWNLSFPAILKAYIDYICVTGITFKYTEEGAVGLCQGKKAVHIVSRGGGYSEGPFEMYEMGDRYLRTIFGFLGITDFTTIVAEKLDVVGEDVEGILRNTIEKAKEQAKEF